MKALIAYSSNSRAWRFLTERRMLLALPTLMATGFINTAVAFHQVLIAGSKGWPAAIFAGAFAAYGATSVAAMLASGWLVDRFTARRLASLFLLPVAFGCLILAAFDAPWAILAYMVLSGASAGAYVTVTTGLLAEVYGVERLGVIRAAAASVMVVSTALSPVIFGVLVDSGLPVDAAIAGLGLLAFAAILSLRGSGMMRASDLRALPGSPSP